MAALLLLIVLSPILLAIALAIKLEDGGPVLFSQERLGLHARPFKVHKFRSMIVDADRFLDEQGRVTRTRLTRVGKFLRFASLDELPQLINILKGEMSIIGPRPVLPFHLPRYTEEQKKRFAMRPGVTGLAQVNGRNQLLWSRRLELDVKYVETYSLLLDLKIFLKTIKVVLFREGVATDRNPDQVDDLPVVD